MEVSAYVLRLNLHKDTIIALIRMLYICIPVARFTERLITYLSPKTYLTTHLRPKTCLILKICIKTCPKNILNVN